MATTIFAASIKLASHSLGAGLLLGAILAAPAQADPVTRQDVTVNGFAATRFTWTDSAGLPRTVSIKREGSGNPGHGGYAVQMTYQATIGGTLKTVAVNPTGQGDDGFGYFVSHERDREFTDGKSGTIAVKIFRKSDSPLGKNLAATLTVPTPADTSKASIVIRQQYPRYGTVAPIPKDADGNDVRPTPTDPSQLALYNMPVTIIWYFQSGTDYPLIRTRVDLRAIGPDLVNFDVRGPYGAMYFSPAQGVISLLMWGDRYLFRNQRTPITRNSPWNWRARNPGGRYSALTADGYEMGLFEPRPFASSALADIYSEARGGTNATYSCPYQVQVLPCDYEWPYQSVQYSLPYDNNNAPTNYPKMAWGSTPYYGTGPSLTRAYDTPRTFVPFNGHPDILSYDTCIVLGRTISGGLTAAAAKSAATYNCAAP